MLFVLYLLIMLPRRPSLCLLKEILLHRSPMVMNMDEEARRNTQARSRIWGSLKVASVKMRIIYQNNNHWVLG